MEVVVAGVVRSGAVGLGVATRHGRSSATGCNATSDGDDDDNDQVDAMQVQTNLESTYVQS